ncbi:MAG: hypothetical protein RIF33_26830 [Cyclobacteriaceae bacterium]
MITITIEKDSILEDQTQFESDEALLEFLIAKFSDRTILVNVDENDLTASEQKAYQEHLVSNESDFSDFKG